VTQRGLALPPGDPGGTDRGLLAVVARNSAFVIGFQILTRVLAFAFNVYVVRRLGAAHFGQYSTVMAYVAVFGIFTDLGLAPYSVREMAEDRARTAWLLPNSIAIRSLLSLVVLVVAPLSAVLLGKEGHVVLGILVASAGQLVWAFQGPLECALIARERLDYHAVFTFAERLVFWVLGTLALVGGAGFIALILASLTGVVVRSLLSAWVLVRRLGVGRLELNARRWPSLLRAALPFGVSGIAFVLRHRFDTILMSFVLTDQAVGWYNVSLNLLGVLTMLVFSFGQALYPSMARVQVEEPAALARLTRRAFKYLLIVSLPIAVGGTILAERIVVTLYTEEFIYSARVLQVMLWALPSEFLLSLLGRLANVLHLERGLARVTVINAGITIALDLLLVPTMGAVGAALAFTISRTISLVQNLVLIGREPLLGQRWGPLLRVFLAAGLMGGAVFFLRGLHLVVSIGVGAVLYGLLVFGLRALEWREVVQVAQTFPGRRGTGQVPKGAAE